MPKQNNVYNEILKQQKEDSPLKLRDDEIIIKKDRFEQLCMAENRCIYLERLTNAMGKRLFGKDYDRLEYNSFFANQNDLP